MGNLSLSTISASQNNKEVTSNEADDQLDQALSDSVSVAIDNTNAATISNSDFRRNILFVLSDGSPAPSAAITITVGAIKRGVFVVKNTTSFDATVTISGQSETADTVPSGEAAAFCSDGSNVRIVGETGDLSGSIYDFGLRVTSTPSVGDELGSLIAGRAITVPANFDGSSGTVQTNPDADFEIIVEDDGSQIGTITISSAGSFTFATTGGTSKSIAAGSRITFQYDGDNSSPPAADASITGIDVTILATVT